MVDFHRAPRHDRTGKQAQVRQMMSRIFELIDNERDFYVFDEIRDCLDDELRLRGWLGDEIEMHASDEVMDDILEAWIIEEGWPLKGIDLGDDDDSRS